MTETETSHGPCTVTVTKCQSVCEPKETYVLGLHTMPAWRIYEREKIDEWTEDRYFVGQKGRSVHVVKTAMNKCTFRQECRFICT